MVGTIIPIIYLFIIFPLVFHCLFVVLLFLFFDDQDDLYNQGTLICHFDFSKDLDLEY